METKTFIVKAIQAFTSDPAKAYEQAACFRCTQNGMFIRSGSALHFACSCSASAEIAVPANAQGYHAFSMACKKEGFSASGQFHPGMNIFQCSSRTIQTHGGPAIRTGVDTGGRDFVSRTVNEQTIDMVDGNVVMVGNNQVCGSGNVRVEMPDIDGLMKTVNDAVEQVMRAVENIQVDVEGITDAGAGGDTEVIHDQDGNVTINTNGGFYCEGGIHSEGGQVYRRDQNKVVIIRRQH